ncbi:hypothetical protein [Marivirga harenae]|uniref:META domain-containing protein n=1 Tax=Marivirga harenae TaxID=2010992 RepID=UPI0026E0925C|nr:hypothetical protein [Marivirga harenae]WKV10740.1 hypothetical protein Q3Y49_11000 [Marivirga harenae]
MINLMKSISMICLVLILGAGCEEEESVRNFDDLIGSWQLAYYLTEDNGRINDPDDGKPVYLTFKADRTFEGMAGNNFIELGKFEVEGDQLILMDAAVTEITTTEWGERFNDALRHSWNGEALAIPYTIEDNELILNYVDNDTMHFLPKE